MKPLALAAVVLALAACKPDPLASYKATCRELEQQKALKSGLSIDQCAQELKTRADLDDPARKADELVDRVGRLVNLGKDKRDAAQQQELKDALGALQELGRPAVAPALAKLKGSGDAELRIALAKVLVGVCAEDCASSRFDCIVPALLEGTTDDKPSAVRLESERGLVRCTGEQLGDDAAAWRKWWTEKEKSAQASR